MCVWVTLALFPLPAQLLPIMSLHSKNKFLYQSKLEAVKS